MAAVGTLLIAAHGCGAELTVDGECADAETRECPCPEGCGAYQGCGNCISAAIAEVCVETCSGDVWGTCDGWGVVEPECTDAPDELCAQSCSRVLRDVLFEVLPQPPPGADETACRAAFAALRSCTGEPCRVFAATNDECQAELTALDQACLGMSVPVCP